MSQRTQVSQVRQTHLVSSQDKFTTDFFLSDGSYGNTAFGNYTSAAGDIANLISGDYTLVNGQNGNIYGNESAKPDTSTMILPTPFTSKGVGSAIPASELGGAETYTTTIVGAVVPATTIPASTVPASISNGSTVIAESLLVESTVPASTLPAVTTVMTRTKAVAATKTGGTAYLMVPDMTFYELNWVDVWLSFLFLNYMAVHLW